MTDQTAAAQLRAGRLGDAIAAAQAALKKAPMNLEARVLLVKSYRQRFKERNYDFKRFRVETQQGKDAKAVPER